MLESHYLTTVCSHGNSVAAVEVVTSLLDQESQVGLILLVNVSDGQDGGGLLVDNTSESGLALDNDVRDVLLSAQSRQPQDKLFHE